MQDTPFKKAAARRYTAVVSAVIIVAAFAPTYIMWPRLVMYSALLLIAATLLVIWLDNARRRAEKRLRRQTLQQGAVAELGRLALSGASVEELSNVAVSVVTRRTDAESAALWELLPGDWIMSVRASVGWTDEFLEGAAVDLSAESMLSRAIDSEQPVVFTRHTSDSCLSEPPHIRREAVSCVNVAVRGRAGSRSVLSVYTDEPRGFTEGDVHFIQAVACVLSSAAGREQETQSAGGSWEMNSEHLTFDSAGQVG